MTKFAAQKLGDLLTRDCALGRKKRGALYVTHVEADDGSWCELDADSREHAEALAINMVRMGARGCSCRVVRASGHVQLRPFFTYYAGLLQPE